MTGVQTVLFRSIKTYKGNTNYKLNTDKAVKVAEIKQDEFWRHLGNIQNNKGETKLVDTGNV